MDAQLQSTCLYIIIIIIKNIYIIIIIIIITKNSTKVKALGIATHMTISTDKAGGGLHSSKSSVFHLFQEFLI